MKIKEVIIGLTEEKARLTVRCQQIDRALVALQQIESGEDAPQAAVVPAARAVQAQRRGRPARPSATPPQPTATRRATDSCPKCGRARGARESGQGFGAHKRHCNGSADREDGAAAAIEEEPIAPPLRRRQPEPIQDGVPCLRCGKRFPNARELARHETEEHFTDDVAMSRKASA